MKEKINTNPNCIFCDSNQVIKFGKTNAGNKRFKCKSCNKTWVEEKVLLERPPTSELVESYFKGNSIRQLVPFYSASPQKINKTIREFLSNSPNWEDYIDNLGLNQNHNIVYLIGQNFSCNCEHDDCNNNFLALAVDAMSSFVLGYQISISNTNDVWKKLIYKLSQRNIKVNTFITKIDDIIQTSIKNYYPESKHFTNVIKANRQKEINCYINKLPIKNRLIFDAVKMYDTLDNKSLNEFLEKKKSSFSECLSVFQQDFYSEIEKRCQITKENNNDELLNDFKDRFEKFHMIKCEPTPLINGWIAYNMLKKQPCGFSRLDFYKQSPTNSNFKDFSIKKLPKKVSYNKIDFKKFTFEIGTRLVQLPFTETKCDKRLTNYF